MNAGAIPISDLGELHRRMLPELEAAFAKAVEDSAFVQGESVRRFEREFGAWCGTGPGAACANGTDGIFLALRALGVGPGDVVAVPAFTFAATAEAVVMSGASVAFVDIDPGTLNIDPASLDAIEGPVRAVVAVHLHGQVADMDALGDWCSRRGALLVEDAAQAHGATWRRARAGTLGDAASFSFYPGKNLGALGDAGIVLARDPAVVARARFLADHGREGKYDHIESAFNMRMDALQAAFLSAKLVHLDEWNRLRAGVCAAYLEDLAEVPGLELPRIDPRGTSAWHQFVVRHERRDDLARLLKDRGVETGVHYPHPLHGMRAFSGFATRPLPVCERAARTVLSLPLHPHLPEPDRRRVVAAVREACRELA